MKPILVEGRDESGGTNDWHRATSRLDLANKSWRSGECYELEVVCAALDYGMPTDVVAARA